MSLIDLFSSIQSQDASVPPPTTTEKNNWLNGTGNVDSTSTPRRNIKNIVAEQLGVDTAEVTLTADLVIDLGASELSLSEFETTFNTGFPRIDWTTYVCPIGNATSWASLFATTTIVGDVCYAWADAENKGKILVS